MEKEGGGLTEFYPDLCHSCSTVKAVEKHQLNSYASQFYYHRSHEVRNLEFIPLFAVASGGRDVGD